MMRSVAALAIALLLVGNARGQQRNAHWPLPPANWMHFTEDGIQVGAWVPPAGWLYGSASISSPTGELQLYNDPMGVYTATGDTLLVLTGLVWNAWRASPGQGTLFCPWPGDGDRIAGFARRSSYNYEEARLMSYTFQRSAQTGAWELEEGSEQELNDSTMCALTAVAHTNGTDYWILSHGHVGNTFLAYRLSAQGVDPTPVISQAGPPLPMVLSPYYSLNRQGSLVASYDGTQLALSHMGYNPLRALVTDLFQFDASTGAVSYYSSLPVYTDANFHGADFSPDGTKLYQLLGRCEDVLLCTSILQQFDVTSEDAGQIAASAVLLGTDSNLAEQLTAGLSLHMASGPDGRIYMIWNGENSLAVINEPNAPGTACNFVVGQVQLLNTNATALPNQCKRYHDSELSVGAPAVQNTHEQFAVWPVPTDGVLHVRTPRPGQVRIADALGRTVATQLTGENSTAYVDLTLAAPGAYAVQWLAPGSPPVCRWVVKR